MNKTYGAPDPELLNELDGMLSALATRYGVKYARIHGVASDNTSFSKKSGNIHGEKYDECTVLNYDTLNALVEGGLVRSAQIHGIKHDGRLFGLQIFGTDDEKLTDALHRLNSAATQAFDAELRKLREEGIDPTAVINSEHDSEEVNKEEDGNAEETVSKS